MKKIRNKVATVATVAMLAFTGASAMAAENGPKVDDGVVKTQAEVKCEVSSDGGWKCSVTIKF